MLRLFRERFTDSRKAPYFHALLSGLGLHYDNPKAVITSAQIAESAGIREEDLVPAFRYWVKTGIVRKVSSKSLTYRYLDPVPLNHSSILRYNTFAQKVFNTFNYYRSPNPYEIQMICSWRHYPGLPEGVILEVVQEMLAVDPECTVKQMENALPEVKTAASSEEAASKLRLYREDLSETIEILRILGQNRMPSEREMNFHTCWKHEWGFSHEAICKACDAAIDSPTFEYLNGILRNVSKVSSSSNRTRQDVEKSFSLSDELRQIRRLIGEKRPAGRLADDYRILREHYSYDLIRLAAEECAAVGLSFESIGRLLFRWEKAGLTSVESATAYLRDFKAKYSLLAEVYEYLELPGKPNIRDFRYVEQWQKLIFDRAMVMKAAEFAFETREPLNYMTKVLGEFKKKGISTPEQADHDRQQHTTEIRRQKEQKRSRSLGANGPHFSGERDYSDADTEALKYFMQQYLAETPQNTQPNRIPN